MLDKEVIESYPAMNEKTVTQALKLARQAKNQVAGRRASNDGSDNNKQIFASVIHKISTDSRGCRYSWAKDDAQRLVIMRFVLLTGYLGMVLQLNNTTTGGKGPSNGMDEDGKEDNTKNNWITEDDSASRMASK